MPKLKLTKASRALIHKAFSTTVFVFGLCCSTYAFANLTSNKESTGIKTNVAPESALLPNSLNDKFYRQALYYYFQNKPEQALSQLNINDQLFSFVPEHVNLFKAGLQISQGLYQESQQVLLQLSNINDKNKESQNTVQSTLQNSQAYHLLKEELLTIVLLQLAEQKIAQQNYEQATAILANIEQVPQRYLAQYYVQQQLIPWPQQPKIEQFNLSQASKASLRQLLKQQTTAPYVQLNNALSNITLKNYTLAEAALTALYQQEWQSGSLSFWQQLFSNNTNDENLNNKAYGNNEQQILRKTKSEKAKTIEQQGIKDYAQLLLAQVNIEQGKFAASYQLLESFPQQTPFSEQALFLFAYSAFKLQQYSVANVVLNKLITEYPFSYYTRQAWALTAEVHLQQNQLNAALTQYLKIEEYYQNKQRSLQGFETQLLTQESLLNLYTSNAKHSKEEHIKKELNLWLTASLNHKPIATSLKQLKTLESLTQQLKSQQEKNTWLAHTITLNNLRQSKIAQLNKSTNYQSKLDQLNVKKAQLNRALQQAKQNSNGYVFANKTEEKLLQRIKNSQQSLAKIEQLSVKLKQAEQSQIKQSQSQQRKIGSYKKRLTRVKGVLDWQLKQQYPQRYWQAQHAVNTLNTSYVQSQQQYAKVSRMLNKQENLNVFSSQQAHIENRIVDVLTQNNKLKAKVEAVLLKQNQNFISKEQQTIDQFLLFNQRAMASVIERLNQQEALL